MKIVHINGIFFGRESEELKLGIQRKNLTIDHFTIVELHNSLSDLDRILTNFNLTRIKTAEERIDQNEIRT